MPKVRTLIHSRLQMSIALLGAASRLELEDPDRILGLLAPAVVEIEREAAELLGYKDRELEQMAVELAEVRAELVRARKVAEVAEKFRRRAEDDAVALGSCEIEGPFACPRGFFVYYLWDSQGEILYVGQSLGLFRRIGAHLQRPGLGRQISKISYVQCQDGKQMRKLELRAIYKHRPPWNIADMPQVAA